MKLCAVFSVLLASVFASTMALPARMAYYQQPAFYYQSQASPQRLMYLQYVQQPSSSQSNARLTNAAAAFVAGDTVATGTYLKGGASEEQQIAEESILDSTGANGAQSIAEAYPEASAEVESPQDDGLDAEVAGAAEIAESEVLPEVPEVPESPELPEDNQVLEDEIAPAAEEAAEEGREINDEAAAEDAPEPAVAYSSDSSAPEAAEPAAVELPEDAENDDDEEDEEAEEDVNVLKNSRRQAAAKPSAAPLPAGTFFPIDFGGADGGAIAIANSFSTGVSGSAKSQAIAYGKPLSSSRSKVRRH